MTLQDLLLHFDGDKPVYVNDTQTGEFLAEGSVSTVLHTLKADDFIVERFGFGDVGELVLGVEVW